MSLLILSLRTSSAVLGPRIAPCLSPSSSSPSRSSRPVACRSGNQEEAVSAKSTEGHAGGDSPAFVATDDPWGSGFRCYVGREGCLVFVADAVRPVMCWG